MATLLRDACLAGVGLKRPLVFRAGGYTRTCAYIDDDFEVLLLNWSAGSASPIHDHGGQHCWMGVLTGELVVDDYVRLDSAQRENRAVVAARGSAPLANGGIDLRSGPFDLHRVRASGREGAVSLHVYARPLRSFRVYDEFAQHCSLTRGVHDASL